jgi:hypothetical protein
MKPFNALVFGSTVGEVRSISRRPVKVAHPKLKACVHAGYLNYTPVEAAFTGIDLCLFCLGVSVSRVSGEAEYRVITHDYAIATFRRKNGIPGILLPSR